MVIYEAVAFALRYWFVFVVIAILICVIIVSVAEYKDKKRIMQYAGIYIGYLEAVYTSGGNVGQGDRFALAVENEIGSGGHCNIVINEPGVLKKHAKVFVREKTVYLKPADPGGNTQINGHAIKDEQPIGSGDIVLFGNTAFMVHLKEVDNQ